MTGPATTRIRALLVEQRDRLEAHRLVESVVDVRRACIATLRVRAAVRTTRPLVGNVLAPLDHELRWLAEALAPVREIDVLVGHLRPQIDGLGDDGDGAKLVVAALDRQRLFRCKELKAAVDSPRFAELFALFETANGSVDADGKSLDRHVARELAKFTRAAAAVDGDPHDLEVQALFSRAQRARYSVELLASERAAKAAKALARAQQLAAKHQDAVVAEERLRALSRPNTAVAVGRFIEREHLRKRAQRSALPKALAAAVRACERAL